MGDPDREGASLGIEAQVAHGSDPRESRILSTKRLARENSVCWVSRSRIPAPSSDTMALPGAWTRQVKGSSESVLPIGFGVFESCFAHLTYPGRGAEMISRYDPFLRS